jgi:hypothetical protein
MRHWPPPRVKSEDGMAAPNFGLREVVKLTDTPAHPVYIDRSMYTAMRRRAHGQAGLIGSQQISIFRG